MIDRATILNLLNKLSGDNRNIFWKIECLYSDGSGAIINQIKLYSQASCRNIGVFIYRVETGMVLFCMHDNLKRSSSDNIVDLLLDLINHSKGEILKR